GNHDRLTYSATTRQHQRSPVERGLSRSSLESRDYEVKNKRRCRDKAIKDLVTHLPRTYYQRIRVPRLPGAPGCKPFWVDSTRLCLRHIGDVTVVLSKRGRNVGPKHTKILVTNLDEWMPRQVVSAYQRRWPVEQINRELKTDLGLGAHQVS